MQKFELDKAKITDARGGTAFLAQITPQAESNRIVGKDSDVVFIDLVSEWEQKAVNAELQVFLAQKLAVEQDDITIASGASVEKKIIIIMGLAPEEIERRLLAE